MIADRSHFVQVDAMIQCVLLRDEVALSVDALLHGLQSLFVPRLPQVTELPVTGFPYEDLGVPALRSLHLTLTAKKDSGIAPFCRPARA